MHFMQSNQLPFSLILVKINISIPINSHYLFADYVKWYGICPQDVITYLNLLDDVYKSDLSLCSNL